MIRTKRFLYFPVIWFLLTVFPVFALALSGGSPEDGGAGTIAGTVYDGSTGIVLRDVSVEVRGVGKTVLTDSEGRYALKVPAGTYELRISRFGYLDQPVEGVHVTAGGLTQVAPVLMPKPSASPSGGAAATSPGAPETVPEAGKAPVLPPQASAFVKKVQIGGLWYLSYENGRKYAGVPGVSQRYNEFVLKRGYVNVTAQLQPWLEARITPDISQDSGGSVNMRLKYLYGKFKGKNLGILNKTYAEFGLVHMPWLDFEEHVNRFRMQGTMFLERNGLFNSADFGVLAGSNFGPEMDEDYLKDVNSHYGGRYGSWQFGVFNGGGYHANELNRNKTVEARGTVRPLPDAVPGLQFSLFGITGKGDRPDTDFTKAPDFNLLNGMVSYEQKHVVLTGQWFTGEGNSAGTYVLPDGTARQESGFSFFSEVRFGPRQVLSAIARFDRFDPNTEDPHSNRVDREIAGFGWQMFRDNYWLVAYERDSYRSPDVPVEHQLQVTLQISF